MKITYNENTCSFRFDIPDEVFAKPYIRTGQPMTPPLSLTRLLTHGDWTLANSNGTLIAFNHLGDTRSSVDRKLILDDTIFHLDLTDVLYQGKVKVVKTELDVVWDENERKRKIREKRRTDLDAKIGKMYEALEKIEREE